MAVVAYATAADLAGWLPDTFDVPADAGRMLARASELVDSVVVAAFAADPVTGLPTDADVAATLRAACCLQVEQWLDVSESNAIDGLAGTEIAVGSYRGRRAPKLAPRAADMLRASGLMGLTMVGVPW